MEAGIPMGSVSIVTPTPTSPVDVLPSTVQPQAFTEFFKEDPFRCKMQAGTTSHGGVVFPDTRGCIRLFLDAGGPVTLLEDPCWPLPMSCSYISRNWGWMNEDPLHRQDQASQTSVPERPCSLTI